MLDNVLVPFQASTPRPSYINATPTNSNRPKQLFFLLNTEENCSTDMPLKKEPCRNFQRGNCRYGEKCKYLHVTQQQPRSNAFGFGSQTGSPFQQTNLQQQKPNPFGFGVQNSAPANGAFNSGGFKQSNTFKPFENKWTRSEQPANQAQAATHKCTDPDSCKRQIAGDFEQERPLWKLTCYGHYNYLPCDITGDISYEELRAGAYDEAKRGTSLQSIVERERNLLNSKLIEFENLLRNPYTKQTNVAQFNQSPFPVVGSTASCPPTQNTGPPAVSGFGSLATSPNMASSLPAQNTGPSAVPSFGSSAPSSNMAFGVRRSNPSNNAFGQFQGSPGLFGTSNTPSGSIASFGSQVPVHTGGNPFTSNIGAFGMSSQGSQLPSTFSVPQSQTPAVNQPPIALNGPTATNGFEQMSMNAGVINNNVSLEVSAVDASIWMKEEWKLGEIPEQPPPAQFVK